MYQVKVRDDRNRIIGSSLTEGLADAVAFGHSVGHKGNRITVLDVLQDATGEFIVLNEVLTIEVS